MKKFYHHKIMSIYFVFFFILHSSLLSPKIPSNNLPYGTQQLQAIMKQYAKPQNSKSVQEKPMVIIIPSYNNSLWYKDNLDSVLNQNYKNYRVIYIDDASSDGTGKLVESYLKNQTVKVTLIKNEHRKGAMENWYNAIHSCQDHEIIVMVDGDDFLAHRDVLSTLNTAYQNHDIWMTYGSFTKLIDEPSNGHHSEQLPLVVIEQRSYRKHTWITSHLRTCYAWLFKQIKQKDFMYKKTFYPVLCDHAMMFPLLEMADKRSHFIQDILLIYNNTNPLNDHKIKMREMRKYSTIIRRGPKYQPLTSAPVQTNTVTSN